VRDCVILGCGRSGTSLAAGVVARAGYNCGEDLLPADDGGPTGFFEARGVNAINEALISAYDGELPTRGYSRPLGDGERWLAVVPETAEPEATAELRDDMGGAIPPSPYCLKDPRFCYTLEAWRPLFDGALFVCVFRHPEATAKSIAKEVRYGDLTVEIGRSLGIWKAAYRRVLDRLVRHGDWLFLHYEQLLDGAGVDRLACALGVRLDPDFADPGLQRSLASGPVAPDCAPTYAELCALAGHPG
jgi:hypothetical protein